jgi:hypothetical protein
MSVSLFLGGWVVQVTKLLGPTPKTKGETKWKPYLVQQPMVSFHIDKTNIIFFQKINSFLKFKIIEFSMIYYDIVT